MPRQNAQQVPTTVRWAEEAFTVVSFEEKETAAGRQQKLVLESPSGHRKALTCGNGNKGSFHCTKTHIEPHTNIEYPCRAVFAAKNQLVEHEKTFHGYTPVVCRFPGCVEFFADKANGKRHWTSHVKGKKSPPNNIIVTQYKCGKCGAEKNRLDNTQRHVRLNHEVKVGEVHQWVRKLSAEEQKRGDENAYALWNLPIGQAIGVPLNHAQPVEPMEQVILVEQAAHVEQEGAGAGAGVDEHENAGEQHQHESQVEDSLEGDFIIDPWFLDLEVGDLPQQVWYAEPEPAVEALPAGVMQPFLNPAQLHPGLRYGDRTLPAFVSTEEQRSLVDSVF